MNLSNKQVRALVQAGQLDKKGFLEAFAGEWKRAELRFARNKNGISFLIVYEPNAGSAGYIDGLELGSPAIHVYDPLSFGIEIEDGVVYVIRYED